MELLGVVAIIGILSALIAVGVVAYNRSLKVMELNNTAEEIYIAAQNHLTALRTNAAAKDTLDTIGYGTKVSTLSSSGAPADLKDKSQWDAIYAFGNSSASSGTTAASGNAVSSGGTAVSGGAVSSGGTTVSGKGSSNTANYAQLSAYILPAGAVDGTVAGEGSSDIIEYNPKAYTVYGVFYADGKSSVLGRDTGETISVTDDLASLNAEVKADGKTKITSYKPKNSSGSTGICVGYYGGSGVANLKSSTLTGSISVKLVNAEKLYAEITTKKLSVSGAGAATQADKNIRLWLTVTGKTSGAIKTYGCTINASGDEGSIDDAWKEQGEIQKSGSGSDMTITRQVVLDDITTAGCHFAEIFGSGKTDNGLNFIPGEDITVSASAAVTDSLSNIVYSNGTQSTNSLFASLQKSSNGTSAASGASGSTSGGSSTSKTTETVTIANFRHLENLSPRVSHVMCMTGSTDADAAVSLTTNTNNGNSSSANLYTSGNFAFKALLTATGKSASSSDTSKTTSAGSDANSMSWSDFFENTGHDEINKAGNNEKDFITYVANVSSTSDKSTSAVTDSTSNGSFSPIENPWLSELDGNNVTIDGVYISSSDSHNEARGLFGTIDQQCDLTIKNLKLQNFDITSSKTAFTDAVSNTNPKFICAGTLAGRIVSRVHTVNIQNVISMEDKDDYCGVWCAGNKTNIVRNGGLIGELQTASDSKAKITVKKCSASVYVQSSISESPSRNKQPGLNDVDIAGGLIGHIEGNGGEIRVENSYSGGHTDNSLKDYYDNSKDKQRGKEGTGRNISSSGITGGLVGAVYSNNAQIVLNNDYSTASVACTSGKNVVTYSDAGGLIGYVSNNVSKINAQDCYSTGLVEGYNRGGVIGYVAKKQEDSEETVKNNVSNAFKRCCFLNGVNTDSNGKEIAAVNILTSHASQESKTNQEVTSYDQIQDSLYPVDVKTLLAEGSNTKAVPYDSLLQGKTYPFASSMSCHYGDWPNVQQNTAPKQNRLMLTFDTKSDLIAIRITGLQSGAHKYIVMNANPSKNSGPQIGVGSELNNAVHFGDDGKVQDLYNADWDDDWKRIFSITLDKDTGIYHYELMLDNISTQFAGFASLSSKAVGGKSKEFYYGEYIDVRITDEITSSTDLTKDNSFDTEYVTNTLFEDIFEKSAVSVETLQNGKVDLNSEVVQKSINKLKHIQIINGKEKIVDIDTPTGGGDFVAVINNARHMENLSSSVSKVNTQNGFSVTNAIQGCDIIWDGSTAGDISGSNHEYNAYVDELTDLNAAYGGSDIYDIKGGNTMSDGCFYPVNIEKDNKLASYNGNGNRIYGIKLEDCGYNGHILGLFGTIDGNNSAFQISNLQLINMQYQDIKGNPNTFGTLVGKSNRKLTLNNVTIQQLSKDMQLKAANECGGMVATANADLTVSNCAINLGDNTFSVSGGTGGAAGIAAICNGNVSVQNTKVVANSIVISGASFTSGMIGNASSAAQATIDNSSLESPSVTIAENGTNGPCGGLIASCQTGKITDCHVSGLNQDTANAIVTISTTGSSAGTNQTGGLVGKVNGGTFTISNSWLGADMATVSNLGSTAPAGGLIGEITSSNFVLENSYVCGANARVMSGLQQQGYVGGLIGELKITNGNCTISNDYFSGYVYGPDAQYAGGLIGRLEAGGKEDKYSTVQNCYVSGRTYNGVFPQDSAELTSGNEATYSRFTMPDQQDKLQEKPIDSVIGYTNVGGLIGCHDNGYLQISNSFTSTSVAGSYDKNDNTKGYVGGLIGYTYGQLKLENSYAVSTVEAKNPNVSVLASYIANDNNANKTEVSNCYVISELNDSSVNPVGLKNPATTDLQITEVSISNLSESGLLRTVPSQDDIDTMVRDATLSTDYPNGYPYIIFTTHSGRKYFDGCWVNVIGGQAAIQLSENETSVTVGQTHPLTATVVPRWKTGGTVTWSSADPAIATVDSDGTVTGVAVGSTTITAKLSDNGSIATCTVTVKDESIMVNDSAVEDNSTQYFKQGSQVKLGFSGSADEIVTWSFSPNVNVQSSDTNQIIQNLPSGTTMVTATINKDGSTVTKTITLIGLDSDSAKNGNFSSFSLFPNLQMENGSLPAGDTRIVKGFTSYSTLYLYISDTNNSNLFGNTAEDRSHYLYLMAGNVPVTVQVKDDNTVSATFKSKWSDSASIDTKLSITDEGTQIIIQYWYPNAFDPSVPTTISLQQYGSTSADNDYSYTMTGLLTF